MNIQGTTFQGAYILSPPNLPPHAQMAPPAVLSECELWKLWNMNVRN